MFALLRQFRAQDRVVQILLINELTIFGSFAMLYPYLAVHFTRDLGFAAWMVGLILGVRVLSQQGLTVVGGTLADRIGYRPVVIAGLSLRTVGFALFGLGQIFPVLLLAAILTGFAGALFSPALRSYLAAETPGRRAEIFALSSVFGQTGNLLGPLIGVALLRVSFQAVSFAASGLFFLLMLLQIRYLPERERGAMPTNASVWRDWGEVLNNRPFLLFSLAMVGYLVLNNQINLGLPLEVQRLTGSDTLVGASYVFAPVLMILGQVWVTARCRANWRGPQAIAAGMLLMGLAFAPTLLGATLLPLDTTGASGAARIGLIAVNISPVVLSIALLSFGMMIVQPFVMELIPILSRERLFGTYFGFYSVASAIGVTVGNTVTGAALDTGKDSGLAGLPWLLMILIGLGSAIGVAALDRRGQLTPAVAATH
ncbi:MAG: MFS transporter [Thermomicrobiales bacterium]